MITRFVIILTQSRSNSSHLLEQAIFLLAVVVSPSFIVSALYALILRGVGVSRNITTEQEVDLASTIIGCVFPSVIIWTYLGFGMPPLPKKKKLRSQRLEVPYVAVICIRTPNESAGHLVCWVGGSSCANRFSQYITINFFDRQKNFTRVVRILSIILDRSRRQ